MMIRGRTKVLRLCAFVMKCRSIFSAISKSAITPSFIGRMAMMLPGVRPSIFLASAPTANTFSVFFSMATTDGSLSTMPRPRTYTSVVAVPRSMARSLENHPKMSEARLTLLLLYDRDSTSKICSSTTCVWASSSPIRRPRSLPMIRRDSMPNTAAAPSQPTYGI